jgi:hypothetical protein
MYGIKIAEGDFVVTGGGRTKDVTGRDRIKQELAAWILEPFQFDPYNPTFGSVLGLNIGQPLTDDIVWDVQTEVTRVVNNYIVYQSKQIQAAQSRDDKSWFGYIWHRDDVIEDFRGVSVYRSGTALKVVVSLTTAAGHEVIVTQNL